MVDGHMVKKVTIVMGGDFESRSMKINELISGKICCHIPIDQLKSSLTQNLTKFHDVALFEEFTIDGLRRSTAMLKKLIGPDPVIIDKKYESPIAIEFPSMILSVSNATLPNIREVMGRRIDSCQIVAVQNSK